KKVRPQGRAVSAATEVATGIESSLDERSREILAEIERDRKQQQALEDQMPSPSPFAVEREETVVNEREPLPVRSADRPSYADTDLDIPSFLRRKND
ncbi:MAG TPA: hypothetical protein VEW45_02315, partial [Candidatus Dormibacteraeota bacterium]|nr:hypothetical protein [Candidatus Dormibacteraeota bacterium]